jgi:salicylate hydroxylase
VDDNSSVDVQTARVTASARETALTIAIVGGGIGGLAAALSLRAAGFEAHVYEQARELGEVGAGIQVAPNASRILHGLGLGERLDEVGVRPLARRQRRWDDGRTLLRTPLAGDVEAAFGFPYYHLHRVDLLATLASALPAERVHIGHRLAGFADRGDRVEVWFDNGTHVEVDALVGADGIHSTVRTLLFGPERPRFTGCIVYRGLVPAERLEGLGLERSSETWMGPGRHFVHYFVRRGSLLNFVGAVEQDAWRRESWSERGEVADALAAFDGFHPQVGAILESAEETFVWGLFDRPPLARWSVGRVTLLGDACHPMLPFMAQGAAQAVEDGATLAACLHGGDVVGSLQRYERLRLPRASRLQALSASNKTRYHLPDGPEQRVRDAQMATGTTDWSADAVAWIWGHDAALPDA